MKKESQSRAAAFKQKHKISLIVAVLLLIFIVIALNNSQSKRSAASFCQVLSDEKSRLAAFPGNSYPSGIFNEELSNAQEFVDSFAKLEKVAPDEIKADVSTLKLLYVKIQSDPSQSLSAGLSGVEPEDNVKEWIVDNCKVNSND